MYFTASTGKMGKHMLYYDHAWLEPKARKIPSDSHTFSRQVHESFRSENILFFPRIHEDQVDGSLEQTLDVSEPWVFGFQFSRPETYFSHGVADICLARDVYRHPHRQRSPTQVFSKIHDIYALGVVLLEIGLLFSGLY
jgi:hypothetical protein